MTMPGFKLSTSEALLCDVLADLEPKARKKAAQRFVEGACQGLFAGTEKRGKFW